MKKRRVNNHKVNAKAKKEYEARLIPSDEYVILNDNDPDLQKWKVKIPAQPEWAEIDGYGVPIEKQKFRHPSMPRRLSQLYNDCYVELKSIELINTAKTATTQKLLDLVWKRLTEQQSEYQDEIKWIKLQWYRILNGYWLFIKGKATYLDGWHYAYCSFWNMDIGLPEYRDRDRRWFIGVKYTYTTTESVRYNQRVNHKGDIIYEPVYDKDGFLVMDDFGFRTLMGFMYPKHRRDGATHKCLSILYFISIMKKGATTGGIQSYTGDNANEHFTKKLIPAWRKMPFFLRPMWTGNDRPAKMLSFTRPPSMGAGDELESKIDYAESASRSVYDGEKLHAGVIDEAGKTKTEDVWERHKVLKPCVSQGGGAIIEGLLMYPSTVADMETGGGDQFYKMSEFSKIEQRNQKTGQTMSGIIPIFIPSWDGLEGFIGPYGESIINKPTEEQAKFIKRNYGAREHIESTLAQFVSDGSPDAMQAYYDFKALHPTCYADCFRVKDGNMGFDIEQLDKGINYARRNQDSVRIGRFEWTSGYMDGVVEWIDDITGPWTITKQLKDGESNRRILVDMEQYGEVWAPENPGRFESAQDPSQFLYKSEAKYIIENTRSSKAAGVIFEARNKDIDPDDKPIHLWETNNFVALYLNREGDDDRYAEEQLKACVYYGAMAFPEANLKVIIKHFINRGYAGYLKYFIDETTKGRPRLPGIHAGKETKAEMMIEWKKWISRHAHKCKIEELLLQCKEIRGPEEMTKYDAFAAGGWVLYSMRSFHGRPEYKEPEGDYYDLENFLQRY